MQLETFSQMVTTLFKGDLKACADFLCVSVKTVRRWLNGDSEINPIAEKLIYVAYRGYLPPDVRWYGFKINIDKACFITPLGREIAPHELERVAMIKDEYEAFVEKYGHIERPPVVPSLERPLPFVGNRRADCAPWIPSSKSKSKSPRFEVK